MPRITAAARPFTLTFLSSGNSYPATSEEVQRLLDEYPAHTATRNKVVLRGDGGGNNTVLLPATRGGGDAFTIDRTCCDHPQRMHKRHVSGAYRCTSFGCGCEVASVTE